MKIKTYKSWEGFRRFLAEYALQSRERRGLLLFWGQENTEWSLQTTLDRRRKFSEDAERESFYDELLLEFRREAIGLISTSSNLPEGEAFELLARHHGLPSILLDWTESPYVASFFAFDRAVFDEQKPVAIWMFDLAKDDSNNNELSLIRDHDLLRFNRRALQQRGVFTRIATVRQPLEDLLGNALTKFVIPAKERELALAELDEMLINASSLYNDLDSVARTIARRMNLP